MVANTILTTDIIAKEAIMQLDNHLVMGKKVYRGYEMEFQKNVNDYTVGEKISIKRPMDFTVRDGATMVTQDTTEGKFSLDVDKQKGIDFEFSSKDLTLNIKSLSERVIKPAMIQLANQVDSDLMALYKDVSSYVGTPGQTINSNQDFSKGPERMDEYANPMGMRCAVLSPQDHWAVVGAQTSLHQDKLVGEAYKSGELGMIAGLNTYMAQNIPTHTVGTYGGTPLVKGATQSVTYATSMNTDEWSLITDGWGSTTSLNQGDVITIADVYAVNPVTKATLPFLKQFTLKADSSSAGIAQTLTLSPAAIATGAHKTVSAVPANNAAITVLGTSGISYRQNLFFCKNAFALVMVPMVNPPGSVDMSRQSYKGTHVRVIPVYDGTTDVSKYRLDILYGVRTVDQRQAHRVNGTA